MNYKLLVTGLIHHYLITSALKRLRMGLTFALAASGSLTGAPIDEALLGNDYSWSRLIIFSGVHSFSLRVMAH